MMTDLTPAAIAEGERLRDAVNKNPNADISRYRLDYWLHINADALLTAARDAARYREALGKIESLKPRDYEFPKDWGEQIDACEECQRYKGHPIQQGICDTHRRPIWDCEAHDRRETGAIGYRAKDIAHAALAGEREG